MLDTEGTKKPNYYLEKPLHSEKITVWAAFSADGITGPFFYEDGGGYVETVNKDRYLNILKGTFLPALRRKGIQLDNIWFQQDGAAPHTAVAVLEWLATSLDKMSYH